jgi:hypothetical protein
VIPPHLFQRLRNLPVRKIIRALEEDGFQTPFYARFRPAVCWSVSVCLVRLAEEKRVARHPLEVIGAGEGKLRLRLRCFKVRVGVIGRHMRTKQLLPMSTTVLLFLLGYTPLCHGQQIQINDCTYKLGMLEREAEIETSKHGILNKKGDNGERLITNIAPESAEGGRIEVYGTLTFSGGRLVKMEKEWLLEQRENTAADVASAIDGAVTSATERLPSACLVQAITIVEPETEYKETFISCKRPGYSREVAIYTKVMRLGEKELKPTFVMESLEKAGLTK